MSIKTFVNLGLKSVGRLTYKAALLPLLTIFAAASSYTDGAALGSNISNNVFAGCSQAQRRSNSRSTVTDAYYRPPSPSCKNDYDCPYGSSCLKRQFHIKGQCVKNVDEYGQPTYNPPNLNSVEVGKEGDCEFDTDCPYYSGFHCVKPLGELKGHCLK